ncbi:5-hydroxytryptamine receptor 1-like [Liolophura sinensis]|uniref:5-hydroxytryptamine receptor 1-like n=1 Tax=Liolophura sinensis TaxID=3198878 RepID=UPI0031587E77
MDLFNVSLESACNSSEVLSKWPVIFLLVFVLVAGVIGNGLVFLTSAVKRKRSSCSQFILHLAIYDMIACVTVIPVSLTGLLQRNIVHHNVVCKIFMFLCLLFALSSVVTLDLVAIDRFLKICRPFSYGISYEASKRLFFLEFITGLVFAMATLFFQGMTRVEDNSSPLYCYRGICLLNNDFYESEYRFVFNLMIAIVLAAMFLVLFVCYALVMRTILRRRSGYVTSLPKVVITQAPGCSDHQLLENMATISKVPEHCHPDSTQEQSVSDCGQTTTFSLGSTGNLIDLECAATDLDVGRSNTDISAQTLSVNFPKTSSRKKSVTRPSCRRQASAIKSAKILSIVTLGFVLCWLPTWALGSFIRLHVRSAEKLLRMTPAHDNAVMFFQFWYLTNHAVNPIIYAFMDQTFRKDCMRLLLGLRSMSSLPTRHSQQTRPTEAH